MVAALDLTGQRFGKLTAVELVSTGRRRKWLCICDCGRSKEIVADNLRSANSKTCGKCNPPNRGGLKHGRRPSEHYDPTYISWKSMRARCTNVRRDGAEHYVLRGISHDPRWADFAEFLADMGDRPAGRTLDRIDNDKGYSKENCRWATPLEQRHNRRDSTGAWA